MRIATAPVIRTWFALTARERLSLALVLALILLGLATRYWHLSRERPDSHEVGIAPTAAAGNGPQSAPVSGP